MQHHLLAQSSRCCVIGKGDHTHRKTASEKMPLEPIVSVQGGGREL